MEHHAYTGSRIKNQFTAYLSGQIRGRRRDYIKKKIQISDMEALLDELSQNETGTTIEENLEILERERLLLKESEGTYPEWNAMRNIRLRKALLMLRDDEQKLIYQHVFEERTFDEMSEINHLPFSKVTGIYYYAIRKIRKCMGVKGFEL